MPMSRTDEGWASVERWVSRLDPSGTKMRRSIVRRFIRWVQTNGGRFSGYTPDQLVEYQKRCDNGSKFDMLDLIQSYILTLRGRYSTKKRYYSDLRSLFAHNRAPLPRDPSFQLTGDLPKVQGTLTVEEVRDLVLSSKPVYRAIFLCMFQGGMDQETFEYWNINGWKSLQAQLRRDPEVVKIDLPGRKRAKNRRPYYTLVGRDAIEALQTWLQYRPDRIPKLDENGKPILDEKGRPLLIENPYIFTSQYQGPITKPSLEMYWRRRCRRLGIVERKRGGGRGVRHGKNLHELRDVFRSQWEKSPAKGSVAEFLMGHVVDPLEYNKAFRDEQFVREEYMKALPMLQIMSSSRPFGAVDRDEVRRLNGTIRELEAEVERLRAGRSDDVEALKAKLEEQDLLISRLQENFQEMFAATQRFMKRMEEKLGKSRRSDLTI